MQLILENSKLKYGRYTNINVCLGGEGRETCHFLSSPMVLSPRRPHAVMYSFIVFKIRLFNIEISLAVELLTSRN